MKYYITLDENNRVSSYSQFPMEIEGEIQYEIETDIEYEKICKCDYVDSILVYNSTYEIEDEIIRLRNMRTRVCFPIINRGSLWYQTLNDSQLEELSIWYQKWLDVTETLEIPEKPKWLSSY